MTVDERRVKLLYGDSLKETRPYTLLFFGEDKQVFIKCFNNMDQLLDFKRYNNSLKKSELKPLDSDSFIWYIELEEKENARK